MKLSRPLFIAALFAASASAVAADTGWYIAADIGRADVSDTKGEIDDSLASAGVTASTSSFDEKDTSYSLLVGYNFNKNFALEGGYIDLGKYNYSANITAPVAGTGTASAEADAWKISAVGILPISDSFSVNGKLHALYSDVKISGAFTGSGTAASGSSSDRSLDFGYGIGLEYKFSQTLSLRGNWDRYSKVGDDSTTGESDIDVIAVGLKYSF